ncbi:MAG TPA: hypothetical protein VGH90_10530 [Chthoniobacteraceae bacterium]
MKPPFPQSFTLRALVLAVWFFSFAPHGALADDQTEASPQECAAFDKELAAFKERLAQIAETYPEGRERGEKELAALQEELQRIDQHFGDALSPDEVERKNSAIDALRKVMLQQIDDEERDQTKGKSDLCPVHHIRMKAKEVPVTLAGDLYETPGLVEARKDEFPYGWDWYPEAGDKPSGIKTAKVYVCPKCVEAWKKWQAKLKRRVKEATEAEKAGGGKGLR